jgi:SNF2 family DNA or RNA helicase
MQCAALLATHSNCSDDRCRAVIREHEWKFAGSTGDKYAARGVYKFNVLITSYHVLLTDWEYFESIRWRAVIVDEAHALKNRDSQLQQALQAMRYDSIVLLTGTPLQNDIMELWALLKLIRPERCVV